MADIAAGPMHGGKPLVRSYYSVSSMCVCGHIAGPHLHELNLDYFSPDGCRAPVDNSVCGCTEFRRDRNVADWG